MAVFGEFRLLLGDLDFQHLPRFFAVPQSGAQRFELGRVIAIVVVGNVRVENPQILENRLVAARLGGLTLQRADLAFDFLDDVLHANQVRLGVFQFAEGFLLLGLEFCNAGSLFKNRAPVLRAVAQDLVDLALFHDRIRAPADAGIHEQLVDVAQAAGGFI